MPKHKILSVRPGVAARVSFGVLGLAALLLTGCRQDMQNQPKFYPQRGTSLYVDGRSARPQVAGTVARSQAIVSDYFHTGMVQGKEGDGLPLPMSMELMRRGQERFNTYCTPCHSRVGNGAGMIVQRGYYTAATFHSTRLRDAPLGHFFFVITNGYGAMPNYAAEIVPEDRWAIAAYIRALQLSQNAKPEDVGAGQRAEPLQNVLVNQGFADTFLDVWVKPERTRPVAVVAAAPASTMPAVVAGVPPTAGATTAGGVAAKTPASDAHASPAEGTKSPGEATVETAKTAPTKQAAPAAAAAAVDTAAGQKIFMSNCALCHQPTRAGLPPNIPSLIGIVPKVGAEHIHTVVTEGIPTGKPPMPSFANKLSEEDITNLIGFLAK